MCIHNVISGDYDCFLFSKGFHSDSIVYGDGESRGKIGCHSNYTIGYTDLTSGHPVPNSPSAGRPVPYTIDQSFETAEHQINTQQPPSHMIDYWFDRLGLSLDPASLENPLNPTNVLTQWPPVDDVNDVSYN